MINRRINSYFLLLLFSGFLFSSCCSLNVKKWGVGRIKKYEFAHPDVPALFEGFKIVFLADFHYKSQFNQKRLKKLIEAVNQLHPDLILLGGDYHEGCQYVPELFSELSRMNAEYGTIAVMGNNDYEDCYHDIMRLATENGIRVLEQESDTIKQSGEQIIITGIADPFDLKKNGRSPTLDLKPEDFVVLLVHTPDYVEDVSVSNTDLALAGHLHGGQVTFFGLYAPVLPSRYGQRFRSGLKHNSEDIPVIITNGIGTSQKNIRMFAPSEIVLITLKRVSED